MATIDSFFKINSRILADLRPGNKRFIQRTRARGLARVIRVLGGSVWTSFIFLSLSGFQSIPAFAQTCSITNTVGNFGSIDILSGSSFATSASFNISCSGSPLATVRLCIEFGPGGNIDGFGNRVVANGANSMRFDLYTSAAYSAIWGSWGRSITQYTPYPFGLQVDLGLNSGGTASSSFTAYGRIYGNQQAAPPGTYTWVSANSPGISYGYRGGSACPTGSLFATTSGTTWTATVASNCLISAASLAFGSAGLLSSNLDATNSVTVTCTNTTPYNISLSAGSGSGATVATRKMTSAGHTVAYSLYRDAGHANVWGNTVGSDTVASTGTGSAQTFTIYGRVRPQTTPAPGTYSDTIVVTVTY